MIFVCIPKSADPTRIRENAAIKDWELALEEVKELATLDPEFQYCVGYMPGHFDRPNSPW
jgi:diketogulonate reductase-like aldo/keto reductase